MNLNYKKIKIILPPAILNLGMECNLGGEMSGGEKSGGGVKCQGGWKVAHPQSLPYNDYTYSSQSVYNRAPPTCI